MNNNYSIFKLNLSLERLSTVAVAIYFWELPTVKQKVHNHLVNYKDWTDTAVQDWDKVIDYVIKQIHLCYPEKLLCNVKHFVQILGRKLSNWTRYVIDVLKCDPKYAEKIYWTSNGDINEFEIVKYWLRNIAELGAVQHDCFLKKPLFCIASAFVQEEFIHSHLEDMKSEIFQYLLVSHRKMDWNDYAVIATWIFFCQRKSKTGAVKQFRKFSTVPNLPAKELFLISVKSGLKFAVQYFFHKLNDAEKQELLIEAASECLETAGFTETLYEEKRYTEILIFLITSMNESKKLSFITEKFVSLFKKFLYMWPYQEICLNLLINDPHYLPGIHDKLLKRMIKDFDVKFYEVKYSGKGIIYNQIFQTLLDRTPKHVKEIIFIENDYKYLRCMKIFDCAILYLIINDSDLKDYRNDMVGIIETHFKKLILKGRYEDLNNLIKLLSFEKQKSEVEKFNPLTTFLTSGKIKLAEEHLNWMYDSDSEKLAAKKRIDFVTVCTNLIKKSRYDLASEYLNWQCDNEEEQKSIKQSMISNGVLLRDQVYQIWCMHKEPLGPNFVMTDVKRKCEELLHWFLESEEAVVEFKKTKLVENESFIEKYWNNLFFHSSFACLENFLEFCFWSPEKIEDLREKIANNIEWWIDTYAVEKNFFLMVDSLFEWVFKDNEERKRVTLKYMETPKGALLILKSFKSINSRSAILRLFNSWMMTYDPIYVEKIKMNLDVCNHNIVHENVISFIKSLLDKVEKGHFLMASDVNRKKINY